MSSRIRRTVAGFGPAGLSSCLWARTYRDIDDLRQAVATFVKTYNTQWLIERLGHQTPRETHQQWLAGKEQAA